MRLLFVGDVFGQCGRGILEEKLKELKETKKPNLIIVNGENIAHGRGITETYYKWLLSLNVSVVTLGNHAFSNSDVLRFINSASKLVRPLNYGLGTPGVGHLTFNYNDLTITVFQVLGRTFEMNSLNCPFTCTEELLQKTNSDLYICDFHGEATSEKIAFGLHFDGRVHIVVGTHTHVQTNDARILPNGTMYITDLGMTGALDGVIGVRPEGIIKRFMTGLPARHEPMNEGRKQFSGLLIDIEYDKKNNRHKVTNFETIHVIQ